MSEAVETSAQASQEHDSVESTELAAPAPEVQSEAKPSPKVQKRPLRRFVQWFTRSDALAQAQVTLREEGPAREYKRRAAAALEVGERILRPIEPLQGGAELLALEAFSQAVFWSVSAIHRSAPASRAEAWALLPETARAALKAPDAVGEVFAADDTARGELSDAAVREHLGQFATLARELVSRVHGPDQHLEALRAQRALRSGVIAVMVTVAGAYGIYVASRGPNLATTASWKASSTLDNCTPEQHKCRGKAFKPFFHTQEEASPWLEYDFGARRRVSKVVVENRKDCCKGRAAPLLVEISDDRKTWTKVAEHRDTFDDVTLTFAPTSGRYLRLRVPKKTALHFESVKIYR
ncbi:MAG: discoidin domain-containing protein [Polyangiaceae bacterium]|nr:discoidin domain-containing protein [Myxococcales bacterium]MCB9584684.1 discoidin domain-containing protein [Polyangiaceae bacterium]MCB9609121.1 discoidin domain-containing protein [Polyangiaceae bacterium]